MYPTPHRDEALCFYRAALPAAALLDRDAPHRMLDAEADHAWRAYDSTLPSAIRFDLVLRDLSLLYPAAFAPGPVFRLAGWYDDDPWGVGFERPPKDEVEALFRKREAPRDVNDALERVRLAWSIGRAESESVAFAERLSPTSQLVVAGARAMLAVAQAFESRPNHQVRSQVLLVSDTPAARHVLGLASALGRQQGLFRAIVPDSDPTTAAQSARDTGAPPATVLVVSSDATTAERACATALADGWNVRDRFEV